MGKSEKVERVVVTRPNMAKIRFNLKGTGPYVQHKFSNKMEILATQTETKTKAKSTKRAARVIKKEYEASMYKTRNGKRGIPATAFRCAMISACKIVGFNMTRAKLCVFVETDDFDVDDGIPLVYIKGKPEMRIDVARIQKTINIPVRAMWRQWTAKVTVNYDADQFSATDVTNLMYRAGLQVGIGEGRHDSKNSFGLGWGTFELV